MLLRALAWCTRLGRDVVELAVVDERALALLRASTPLCRCMVFVDFWGVLFLRGLSWTLCGICRAECVCAVL